MSDLLPSIKKRQILTICGIVAVVLALTLLIISFPWLQLQLANYLIQGGSYAQAEQILSRLVEGKPDWTEPRYNLALSQLFLGKGSEAASTVISLADASQLEDMDLAMIFMDVAEHLVTQGHGDAALELANKVLTDRAHDEMLNQAVIEVSINIAQRSDLPLSLDAINTALSLTDNNWLLNRKAFNILLDKALDAPADLAEPALDAALNLYPNNIIALASKASLLGSRSGPQTALEYLLERERAMGDPLNEDYLNVKWTLVTQLATRDQDADLTKYIRGVPRGTVVEFAIQGLKQALHQGISGYQYYQLAMSEPEVAYQYGRTLFGLQNWDAARSVFHDLQELDANFVDFDAVYAALDSKTATTIEEFRTPGASADMASISPDGSRLAQRLWINQPPMEENLFSNLVVVNFSDNSRKSLGDVQVFQWSPDGRYLIYIIVSPGGQGRLHIYSVRNDTTFALPGEHNVIGFNWADKSLMVQVENGDKMRLLHLSASDWRIVEKIEGHMYSAVNHDYAWITVDHKSLLIHRPQLPPQELTLDQEIMAFTGWSPNGNLSIITDRSGQSWIYKYSEGLSKIPIPGEFAAWGQGQDIFWYLPIWEKQYVLVRLDASGNIEEYLPYSFTYPYYDLSITDDGQATVIVEDNEILIHRR